MFFEPRLLCKGGRFHLVWIAANRGANALTSNQIKSINIEMTCDQLMEYVISHSTHVSRRFSLVLSSKLIHGICKIYKHHVELVFKDVVFMMNTTPKSIFPDTDSSRVPVVPKKRAARKKKQTHAYDEDLIAFVRKMEIEQPPQLQLEEQAQLVPRESITLPELDERFLLQQDQARTEFGFGDLGRYEDFLLFEQNMAQPVRDQQIPEMREDIPLEVIQEAPVQKVPVAPVPLPEVTQVAEQVAKKLERRAVPNLMTFMKLDGKRRPGKMVSNVNIQISSKREVIDRQKSKISRPDPCIIELMKNIQPQLVRKFFEFSQVIEDTPEIFSWEQFRGQQKTRAGQRDVVEVPEVEVPQGGLISESRAAEQSNVAMDTGVASVVRSADSTQKSRAGISGVGGLEFESVQPLVPPGDEGSILEMQVPRPVQTSTPCRTANVSGFEDLLKKRLGVRHPAGDTEKLLNILRRLEQAIIDDRVPLTLDQVANTPITRRTIASAFGGLLVLAGAKYVELITEDNSCELKHITFGGNFPETSNFL